MAQNSNPFEEGYEEDITTLEDYVADKPPAPLPPLTVDTIAEYLLKKQYILTALEFHTEILESGKELARLKNYFSNPANFEQTSFRDPSNSGSLYRTSSCSTFDSLDLTRFSDDGTQQVDDRLAVLEFELRKAKETIKSLRANLTDAVEQDSFLKSPAHDGENGANIAELEDQKNLDSDEKFKSEELKPLEKRALNYLINEYLLQNDYKLTSITLADEIDDQDFEDWDDVGLNMPKPPNLLKLYRQYALHANVNTCSESAVESNHVQDLSVLEDQKKLVESLQDECDRLQKENSELASTLAQFDKAIHEQSNLATSTPIKDADDYLKENLPEHFAEAENELNDIPDTKKEVFEDVVTEKQGINSESVSSSKLREVPERNEKDWVPLSDRMTLEYWNALLSFSQVTLEDNWLLAEVSAVASTWEELVSLLSKCLPKIIPTVLLQKRENLIPLLLCTAAMNSSPEERNQLLHELFNLIKKPDASQRQMILYGCVAYAKHVGPTQTEEDLLPQCWEQLGHKYAERRHLVAEACGALAPYMHPEMRSSLLLSILQQMQEDEKSTDVRQAVVRSLSLLFPLLQDDDKYRQAFEMLRIFLRDSNQAVRETTKQCLLPSFASWARQRGKLYNHLIDFVFNNIESLLSNDRKNDEFDSTSFLDYMEMLHVLLPHYFTDVLLTMPPQYKLVDGEISENKPPRTPLKCDILCDPIVVIGNEGEYNSLTEAFDAIVTKPSFDDWETLNVCLNQFLPRLLQITRSIGPQLQDCISSLAKLFRQMCYHFGKPFLDSKLKVQFQILFLVSGNDINHQISHGKTALTSAAVAVYAGGILTAFNEKARKEELSVFLKDMINTLSSCYALLDSVIAAFREIRKTNPSWHAHLVEILWSCVTNASANIRANAASIFTVMVAEDVETRILTTRILPALITLSTDIDSDVRTASIPALAAVAECSNVSREIIDQVVNQMTTFTTLAYEDLDDIVDGNRKQPLHHNINLQLVRTAAQVGPKAHPKFRDEFVLPHLAAIAAGNNQATNKTKRSDIALELLSAYSNISCCFISDDLLQSAFLPGVRCLLHDMENLHPEHIPAVNKLIKEKEAKLDRGSIASSSSNDASAVTSSEKITRSESKLKFKLF